MNKQKKRFIRLTLTALILVPCFLFAQTKEQSSRFQMIGDDLTTVSQGALHILSNPLRWEQSDWLLFGGTLAGGILIFTMDDEIDGFFKRNRSNSQDKLAEFGSYMGRPITVVALTAAIYSYGIIAKNDWARETAIIFTASLIPGGIVQTVSKTAAGRARPYMGFGKNKFEPFKQQEDYNSFVSGHTLVTASTALILAQRVNNVYLKGLFYSVGLVGAWARMYQRNHFASDVFLGMALGYATVNAAFSWINQREKTENKSYGFYFNSNRIGLIIAF